MTHSGETDLHQVGVLQRSFGVHFERLVLQMRAS
jgi:hypothetical protein